MQIREKSWLKLVFRLRGATLRLIKFRLTSYTLFALFIALLHTKGWYRFPTNVIPFTLIGVPLGIFLGFRSNQGYNRYWEGRKLWGELVNTCRNFNQQLMLYLRHAAEPAVAPEDIDASDTPKAAKKSKAKASKKSKAKAGSKRAKEGEAAGSDTDAEVIFSRPSDTHAAALEEASNLLMAYPYALRLHLTQLKNLESLAPFLSEAQLARLSQENNIPAALVYALKRHLQQAWREGRLHDYHLPMLEENTVRLLNVQGGCERIKNTPLPVPYTVLTHRIISIYCAALPFGIVDAFVWFTPVIVLFVGYFFLSLDIVSDELEDPFEIAPNALPMLALSRTIEINIRQRLEHSPLPPPIEAKNNILP